MCSQIHVAKPGDAKDIPPGERFIRLPEVLSITALKRSTIYNMQASGAFPKKVPLPGGRSAWLESEVRGWMQERIALRESAA